MSWEVFDEKFLEYDRWFETKGEKIYLSELKALKKIFEINNFKKPIFEIGVGTGRFSIPLNIKYGIEPSEKMSKIAKKRGIKVVKGTAEDLPLKDKSVGTFLLIVTICFLDNLHKSLKEIKRVLKNKGDLIIGFVPQNSEWGKLYIKKKKEGNPYYKSAEFYEYNHLKNILQNLDFKETRTVSTLTLPPQKFNSIEEPFSGYNKKAGFVIIRVKAFK